MRWRMDASEHSEPQNNRLRALIRSSCEGGGWGHYPDAVEDGSVRALGREHRARLGAPDLIERGTVIAGLPRSQEATTPLGPPFVHRHGATVGSYAPRPSRNSRSDGEGAHCHCRNTSLARKRTPLGPYRRPMPRVQGGWAFLMGEAPLYPNSQLSTAPVSEYPI